MVEYLAGIKPSEHQLSALLKAQTRGGLQSAIPHDIPASLFFYQRDFRP